jgi:hypothetical protein
LLGVVAHQTGHARQAVELISQAISLRGAVPAYYNNLGEAYRTLGQHAEAIAAYNHALVLDPHFAEAHNNLGTIYKNQGRLAEALACFDRAIACHGDYANARYNRALLWLSLGDYARGWPEYEWRWKRAEFRRPALDEPHWDGSPLGGRTLLVRAEQGLGDTVQFIRYVPLLQAQGNNLVVEVQAELVELLSQSGIGPLVPQQAPLPRFDVHASLLSLPSLLGTRLDTIPSTVPYLSASAARVLAWQRKLADRGRVTIGIAWQGNPRSPLEPGRSIPLAEFEPLARVPGVQLVSLQKGFGSEQIPALAGRFPVLDLSAQLDQAGGAFVDTAAVMRHMDLVITSDSAVAHLAGALARPVWVVLPAAAEWRWMRDRSDSPWYPTMRLFRQSRQADWSSVLGEVADELTRRGITGTNRPN